MDIFEKEVLYLKEASTFLLYADSRINILEKAKDFTKLIIEDDNDILNHPDVKYYESLRIDDVRNIILESIESSAVSKRKVYILGSIEKAQKEVLNGLLKVIEEPPKNVYFILLTRSMNILDTIKSRSIKINLNRHFMLNNIGDQKKMYKFLENDIEYFNEYIKIKDDINLEYYEVKDFEKVYENIQMYFKDKNIYTRIGYEYAIWYLVKNIRMSSEEESLEVKDRLFKTLFDNLENKIMRERMVEFFNSCILKYIETYKINRIEKLLEYKLAINSNVNMKLIFLLFMLEISR